MVVSFSIAFFAGLISFVSPCVLPLIPGYVSFICGTTLNELNSKSKNFILRKSLFFSLGFSLVFVSLGATASFVGSFLLQNSKLLSIGSGLIIIFFGIYLLELIKINFLNKNFGNFNIRYSNNLLFPFIVGIGFGFGWTPCIGPILGSILAFASMENSIYKGISLLSFYSLGLAVPFVLSSLLIKKFLIFSKSAKKYLDKIKKISGFILILTGILIITGKLQILGFYLIEYFPILQKLG
ncbi:MAG: cytochrome c biogenesis protein CcdA [Alphaproteobacteria bacterium]|mgnify:CR=1 FL=1|jgi:cytochrome c-type biogenesis protein|nr:cytochrome c biogenesis protein CcdA [Candidatus Fonsibacter sp. PEL55]